MNKALTIEDIKGMEDRELDAAVASMLGWTDIADSPISDSVDDLCGRPPGLGGLRRAVPYYSSVIAADYEVLKHVCETWGVRRLSNSEDLIYAFHAALAKSLRERMDDLGVSVGQTYTDLWLILYYRPGDYSRAALLARTTEGE